MADYHLKVLNGPEVGATYPLTSVLTSIGRYSGNAIMILDDQVSRFHARIGRSDAGCTIEDVGSANGVFVNGTKTSGVVTLKPGDVIRLGKSVELAFNEGSGDTAHSKQEVLDGGDKKGTMMVGKDDAAHFIREELAKQQRDSSAEKTQSGGLFGKLFGGKKDD
jgi:pSer/pThr/pTyr-binding forkhead associated (FHA) protein